MTAMRFVDRVDGGRRLARELDRMRGEDVVVLGLPRGGVPVAAEVAHALGAPLDVIVVRKLGVPRRPELAMGAIGEDGVRILNGVVVRATRVDERAITAVERAERTELARRVRRFRGERARIPLAGRVAVVVDDGMATGATAAVACRVARAQGARSVVLAVPVAAPEAVDRLRAEADEVVCLTTPALLYAVGQWYDDFRPTTDDDVCTLLAAEQGPPGAADDPPGRDEDVTVPVNGVALAGRLTMPAEATGVVVFAHGSGSSRLSPRNQSVAAALNDAGLATLLLDLLTPDEATRRDKVFDIRLLATRLAAATRWLRAGDRWIGYFGASTGAAAALWAAAEPDARIAAVVSRGGRPDLAKSRLSQVSAPTLLIVGGEDHAVLDLNQRAQTRLSRCEHRLVTVPGATHLFDEPGALTEVARLATDWFTLWAGALVGHPER